MLWSTSYNVLSATFIRSASVEVGVACSLCQTGAACAPVVVFLSWLNRLLFSLNFSLLLLLLVHFLFHLHLNESSPPLPHTLDHQSRNRFFKNVLLFHLSMTGESTNDIKQQRNIKNKLVSDGWWRRTSSKKGCLPCGSFLSWPHTFSERSQDVFISTEVNQRVESTVQTNKATTELTGDVHTVRPFWAHLPIGLNSWPKVEVLE